MLLMVAVGFLATHCLDQPGSPLDEKYHATLDKSPSLTGHYPAYAGCWLTSHSLSGPASNTPLMRHFMLDWIKAPL